MRIFKCQSCGQVIFFANTKCERCGHALGFLPPQTELSALEPEGVADGRWRALAAPGTSWRRCDNARYDACNWMLPADSQEQFCTACRHNRTIPDLSLEYNLLSWRKMERAKHRLFYTLLRLGLPMPNRNDDPENGLVFDFLSDPPQGPRVLTGHDSGLITMAMAEADDAEKERRRSSMHEPYRTLLGHFRHEVGHFYWDLLVRDAGRLDAYRQVFGDEREDYGQALQRHYDQGPPSDWQQNFVSAYATAHPWEDWAETWAHYLHTVDSLETAAAFRLGVSPEIANPEDGLQARVQLDPYSTPDFSQLIAVWTPLTIALNAMNRSMGLGDVYPFILSEPVIRKLGFIHTVLHER